MNKKLGVLVTCYSILFITLSCKHSQHSHYERIVKMWMGKEIKFPSNPIFTIYLNDTVSFDCNVKDYKIVSYIDSNGCVSCKLQLLRWKEIMEELDSVAGRKMTYCFFFAPLQVKEPEYLLHRDEFDIPICIDETAQINSLNNFPNE